MQRRMEPCGAVDVAVPLYLDGSSTAYLTPHLIANAVPPRLTYDRPELVLPTVPLGHVAKASLYVINEGYDNLQIQAKLPIDSARMPLTLEFPEGSLVGVSKERLLITVAFVARKPTAFTAFVELIDGFTAMDHYILRWRGYINIVESGDHTFQLCSDDGNLLYINEELVVDVDGLHGACHLVLAFHLHEFITHCLSIGPLADADAAHRPPDARQHNLPRRRPAQDHDHAL